MVNWILRKLFGSKNARELRRLAPVVRRINEFDDQFKSLSDEGQVDQATVTGAIRKLGVDPDKPVPWKV